ACVDVVCAAHAFPSARVPHENDPTEVDRALEAETQRAWGWIESLVPAAEELDMSEYQTGAREVQAAVFDEGMSRRSQVLCRTGGDSAVGVDGNDEVAVRCNLLGEVRISFVAR